jgi:hypothetical protein
MTYEHGEDLCLNCAKPVNPNTAIWLYMNCSTGEFTDSEEVGKEWEERGENQGAFAFGPDCGPRMLKDHNKCKFKGAGH